MKRFLLILLLFPFLLGVYGEVQPDGTYSLVGIWHLNGNGNDDSGNGLNAATISGAIYSVGFLGGGYWFDGNNDYIQINDPGTGSVLDITGNITIAMWVKVDAGSIATLDSTLPYMFSKGTWDVSYTVYAGCYNAGNDGYTFLVNNAAIVESNADASGNWEFLVFMKSGTTGYIYIDGELDASDGSPAFPAIGTNNSALYISYSSDAFPGIIDEVILWDRALSATEIRQLYQSMKGQYGIVD